MDIEQAISAVLWTFFGIAMIIIGFPFALGIAVWHLAHWVTIDKLGWRKAVGVSISWAACLVAFYVGVQLFIYLGIDFGTGGEGSGCASNRYCD